MTVAALVETAHAIPPFSRREWRADAFVHVTGVAVSLAAGLWLVVSVHASGGTAPTSALAAYAMAMIGMLSASAAYNLTRGRPSNDWLRRVDHVCIFLAIAGTYTPFLTRLAADEAAVALAVVWSMAAAGAVLKLSAPRRYERLGLGLYLGLGWIGAPLAPALSGHLRNGTASLIGLGLLIYTLGTAAYRAERMRYHNVIWHLAVLAAATCHYLAMWTEFGP